MFRILAMSIPRKEAIDRMSRYSNPLSEHLVKYVIYRQSLPTSDHWISEMANFMRMANRQSFGCKLKEKDYLNSIFSCFGTTWDDAEANISDFWMKNRESKSYPEFDILDEFVDELFETYKRFIRASLKLLLTNKKYTMTEWEQAIRPALR